MGTGPAVSAVSMRRQGRRETWPRFQGFRLYGFGCCAIGSTWLTLDVTVVMAASMPMIKMWTLFSGGVGQVFDLGLSGMSISTLQDLSGQVCFAFLSLFNTRPFKVVEWARISDWSSINSQGHVVGESPRSDHALHAQRTRW